MPTKSQARLLESSCVSARRRWWPTEREISIGQAPVRDVVVRIDHHALSHPAFDLRLDALGVERRELAQAGAAVEQIQEARKADANDRRDD